MHQSNLDGVVTREPKQPPFTTAGLLDYIVELVVCEDEVSVVPPSYSQLGHFNLNSST